MSGSMKFSVQELRPEVLAFALLMEERLRERDADKGQTWKEKALFGLSTAALAKASFVQTDIVKNHRIAATKHVVDVANYCMMIADVAGSLLCGNKHDGIPCSSPKGSHCPDCKGMHEYAGE